MDELEGQRKPSRPRSKPERLVYWYFRINGFLLLENFMLHPDMGPRTVSDVDLVAVRFVHRRELFPPSEMEDDERLFDAKAWVTAHLVEVKTGMGRINPSWRRTDAVERALRAVGLVPPGDVPAVAEELRNAGHVRRGEVCLRITVIGSFPEPQLRYTFISFNDIIRFLHERFTRYKLQKSNLSSWPEEGRFLREALEGQGSSGELEAYSERIKRYFGLP